MQNSKFTRQTHYFSGQGVVMLGIRDPNTGLAKYFSPLGNCSDLKVQIATTVLDKKGAQDGQRAIEKRIQIETKATAMMTIQNWDPDVLARATRGDYSVLPAATAATQNIVGYKGKVVPLNYVGLSNFALTQGATPLVAYVDDLTPYDYKVNLDAGSVRINDGTVVGFSALGTAATAIAVGSTTTITVANSAAVGDTVALSGFTGADASFVNGKTPTVTAATGTTITVNINTTGKTITATGTPKVVFDGAALTATYDYQAQSLVNALTQPLSEISIRFEGLNTADGNSPVVVDLFKFSVDPLKELALLTDTFGEFQIEGALLYDNTKSTGSKFFTVKELNTAVN